MFHRTRVVPAGTDVRWRNRHERPPWKPGLQGVVAARTRLSRVDGERGELLIAGLPVAELARGSFEAAAAALAGGTEAQWRRRLGDARVAAADALPGLAGLDQPDAMAALQAGLAQLPIDDGADALGAVAVLTATWIRSQRGLPPLPPDPTAPHARDLHRLATGEADPAAGDALGRYLITVGDHGLNASTFAARVVASTGSDLRSTLLAGLGALKGPLHGGAPGPVLDMLDAVGSPDRAAAWVRGELDAGRRIMGMGHRVYRVRDPRAAVLQEALQTLGGSPRAALADAIEAAATAELDRRKPGRALRANVEFFTAVLLERLGLPREAFTATFACGRALGWSAHVAEERRDGRIMRPRAEYVGPVTALRHP